MSKIRVLVVLGEYPTLSQTYKENELRALLPHCEVRVLTFRPSQAPYRDHLPFASVTTHEDIEKEIKSFNPDVVHGHYLSTSHILAATAELAKKPFTVRTHSFDVLGVNREGISAWTEYVNRSSCLAVLSFPFLRATLVAAGICERKIIDSWPVIDFLRFHDTSPNGDEVLNTGACLPKKNMESYIDLAKMVPERQFNIYPVGYQNEELQRYNVAAGSPVQFHPTVEPYQMPRVYKRHQWLVYSANPHIPTVGWPLSIAEAQAAGVGVAIQRVRTDLETYVDGAGFVFDTIEEAARIIRAPYPSEMRERGFTVAKRSDIQENIRVIIDVWRNAV